LSAYGVTNGCLNLSMHERAAFAMAGSWFATKHVKMERSRRCLYNC
jgi:hypothetical protein